MRTLPRFVALLALLVPLACNKPPAPPKSGGDSNASGGKATQVAAGGGGAAVQNLRGGAPRGQAPQLVMPKVPKDMVSGTVSFFEKSGKNLYVELKVGGKTVGVELFPKVAKSVKGMIEKGMALSVRGKRNKGEKDIAFVVEVRKRADLLLPGDAANKATLVKLRLAPGPLPAAPVEMIAGIGIWPPADAAEVNRRVDGTAQDGATLMVTDTGLTELWKAYDKPGRYLEVIGRAAARASAKKLATAYYFPSFELRREKGSHGKSLLARAKSWAQVTLAGKPVLKTRFSKEEFWNSKGDEALWVSPLSPWRKVFIGRMKQAVQRGATTLFIDVPYLQGNDKFMTDGSKYARAAFKKATGLALPRHRNPGDATYHRFLWWRHEVLRSFFAELRTAIRGVNPAARLVVEEFPAYIDKATTNTGLDIGLTGDEVDAFAHEFSRKQFDKKPFSSADRLATFATLSLYRGLDDKKPTWVLSYAHDTRGSRINAALHLALDASFWETKAPEMNNTTVGRKWRRKLFGWFGKHRDWFGNSLPLGTAAVIYSPRSRDFGTDHFKKLEAVISQLTRAGITYRVLSTRDLDQLSQYNVAILPSVAALSKAEAQGLARAGVPLVSVGKAPSKGPWGIESVDHGLSLTKIPLASLTSLLSQRLVKVSTNNGAKLGVALWQRRGELQVRLVSLDGKKTRATVSLRTPVAQAEALPFLGQAKTLTLDSKGDTVNLTVDVDELTLIRLRLK